MLTAMLQYQNEEPRFFRFLVDSGADCTLIPKSVNVNSARVVKWYTRET